MNQMEMFAVCCWSIGWKVGFIVALIVVTRML